MFSGWEGLGSSVAGAILLALPYAVLFVFAGGGAGDAKMMAGIGAWLGLKSGVTALLFVSIFGIMVALLAAANKKKFLAAVDNIRGIIFSVFVFAGTRGRVNTVKEIACGIEGQKLTVPYGPAIFMGVVSAAVYTWMF
jgi:prepilin signal peptidase PulO-like enzyme (type II secretory pathway)